MKSAILASGGIAHGMADEESKYVQNMGLSHQWLKITGVAAFVVLEEKQQSEN